MDKVHLEELKEAAISNFSVFCELMQEDGWFDPVHRKLCMWMQRHFLKCLDQIDKTGTCNGKLMGVMPRGSLKSTMITKYFPVWVTIYMFYKRKDSSTRSLIAGNTFKNSSKKLEGVRGLFDVHPIFRSLFPEILPKKGRDGSRWTNEGAEINRTGSFDECTFECAGTNTKLTGRHYNIILEDDTTAPDETDMKIEMTLPSRDTIEKAIGFHKASMPLFVPKGLRISVIISTRWSMEDLVAYVQGQEEYFVFDMPAIDKSGHKNFSCFYDDVTLAEIRKRIGSYMFNMLYLNQPEDPSTRIFNRNNFHWIKKEDLPTKGFITLAVDPAISEEEEACDSSITVNLHQEKEGKKFEYWLKDENGRWLPFQLAKKILDTADIYDNEDTPVKAIIIEGNAYQKALKYIIINLMNERASKGKKKYNIISFNSGSKSGKHLRIRSMQPSFEQDRIFFLSDSLSNQTESQLVQYPNGSLVDTIDSWSMHRVYFGYDKYTEARVKDEPEEDTFEAAVAEIKKKLGISSYGLAPKGVIEHDFYGLGEEVWR